MKELYYLIKDVPSIEIETMMIQIMAALALGIVIYISYYLVHLKGFYSKSFNTSLVVLAVLTATITTVINNNLVLSIGMIGALSVVRFRTALKNTRDSIYIFWAVIVGICCGAGQFTASAIGTVTTFIVLILFNLDSNDQKTLIAVRGSRKKQREIQSILFDYYKSHAGLKVENINGDEIEMIFEVNERLYQKALKSKGLISDVIYNLGDITSIHIIRQNDETNN